MVYQTLQYSANIVHSRKFIALTALIRNQERSTMNYLSFYLRKLEIEEEIKSKVSRRKQLDICKETQNTDLKEYMHPYLWSLQCYLQQQRLEAAQVPISRQLYKKSCGTFT